MAVTVIPIDTVVTTIAKSVKQGIVESTPQKVIGNVIEVAMTYDNVAHLLTPGVTVQMEVLLSLDGGSTFSSLGSTTHTGTAPPADILKFSIGIPTITIPVNAVSAVYKTRLIITGNPLDTSCDFIARSHK